MLGAPSPAALPCRRIGSKEKQIFLLLLARERLLHVVEVGIYQRVGVGLKICDSELGGA